MSNSQISSLTLEQQIKQIYETLKEVENNQKQELNLIKNNHTINMKKLEKIQEYNKIADMTNQIFEKRLSGIENTIKLLNKNNNL